MTSQPFNQGGGDGSQGSPALSVLKWLERGQTNANRAGWLGIVILGWRAGERRRRDGSAYRVASVSVGFGATTT